MAEEKILSCNGSGDTKSFYSPSSPSTSEHKKEHFHHKTTKLTNNKSSCSPILTNSKTTNSTITRNTSLKKSKTTSTPSSMASIKTPSATTTTTAVSSPSASILKHKLSNRRNIEKNTTPTCSQHQSRITSAIKGKKLTYCENNNKSDDISASNIKISTTSATTQQPTIKLFTNRNLMNENCEKSDKIESDEEYDDAVGSSMESTINDNKDDGDTETLYLDCITSKKSLNKCQSNINNQIEIKKPFCHCSNSDGCITLKNILSAFNAPISEDQAWALIFQYIKLYRDTISIDGYRFRDLQIPYGIDNLNLHNDGSVHINTMGKDIQQCTVTSQKKILMQIGRVIFEALDYNLQEDEVCSMSSELEELISYMTFDEIDDEGIERDSEDYDEEKCINNTKELDDIIQTCMPRVQPAVPENHYKAVCRALVTEALELRIFLQRVFHGDTEALRIKVDAVTSKQELDKLQFNDWARFWMQVVDELRRGVRLKKSDSSRAPVEYELTPYEILMGDIRARRFNLRKVMVNGDIPPRVKKDAHAVILEFIRSRPPLKKATDRKLPPPIQRNPSPREQLMDSIRKGRSLRPVSTNFVPPATTHQVENTQQDIEINDEIQIKFGPSRLHQSPRTKQRLIKVDFSLLQDDEDDFLMASGSASLNPSSNQSSCSNSMSYSQPRMPAYPISGYSNENNPNNINTVLRRTTYDLATQCESRRASLRRHTIVGCQSNFSKNETHSMPPSRPNSRQSNNDTASQKLSSSSSSATTTTTTTTSNISNIAMNKTKKSFNTNALYQTHSLEHQHNININNNNNNNNNNNMKTTSTGNSSIGSNLTSMETWTKNSLDENQWSDKVSDRLSLTLEEIVHIRSVMTKAELEGLPVGVRVKEDVERRKVCFLCLKTRFSIFGSWGIQCKLCQRTVCSKCYSKMRIPTEHFRNVPVVLLSPSLMGSPASSSTPSPSHHVSGGVVHVNSSAIMDESFPKSLMERLLRTESDRKTRNTVGSAPSSPKNQRSNMSTPGTGALIETSSTTVNPQLQSMTQSMTTSGHSGLHNKENNFTGGIMMNGSGCAQNRQVAGIMSRSMEGPRSLPLQSPGRPHSNSSTLDRKNRFARAFTLSSSAHLTSDQKEHLRGEMMAVCNDCRGLVLEIIRSSRQTRSSARNRTLKNLTLDLSPVYKY